MTTFILRDARFHFDLRYLKNYRLYYNTIALASSRIRLHFSCICEIQQIVNASIVFISLQHNVLLVG